MRMRHKPYARPELAAWPFFIDEPCLLRGQWKAAFKNPGLPLRVEYGCGKGQFLACHAAQNPQANHLGIDIKSEVLVVAKRSTERIFAEQCLDIDNILFTGHEIELIDRMLSAHDLAERLYINFCNPWSKSGYVKHRLTHPRQLINARRFLKPNAEIWFKTDDNALFIDSLRYLDYSGFSVVWQTDNLHKDEPSWNVRTEHENMFAAQNIAIHACIARMRLSLPGALASKSI